MNPAWDSLGGNYFPKPIFYWEFTIFTASAIIKRNQQQPSDQEMPSGTQGDQGTSSWDTDPWLRIDGSMVGGVLFQPSPIGRYKFEKIPGIGMTIYLFFFLKIDHQINQMRTYKYTIIYQSHGSFGNGLWHGITHTNQPYNCFGGLPRILIQSEEESSGSRCSRMTAWERLNHTKPNTII